MTVLGRTFTRDDLRRVVWTAVQAGVSTFFVLAPGFWKAPNVDNAKALAISVAVAAGSALLSAVKNWFLSDTSSLK